MVVENATEEANVAVESETGRNKRVDSGLEESVESRNWIILWYWLLRMKLKRQRFLRVTRRRRSGCWR